MILGTTSIANLKFDPKTSILHVEIIKDAEMNKENLEEHYRIINEITNGKRHLALIDSKNTYFIDFEAMRYASSQEVLNNRLAVAYFNPSLPNRLSIYCLHQAYCKSLLLRSIKCLMSCSAPTLAPEPCKSPF